MAAALALALLFALGPGAAMAEYRRGPLVLDQPPADRGEPEAWSGKKALVRDMMPAPLVDAVKSLLAQGDGVLLVGHTDTIGPRLLNRSLGLQYAVETAHRLSKLLNAEPWRFACATVGEVEGREEPGVEVYRWTPPPPKPACEPTAISILSPPEGAIVGNRFWPVWDTDGTEILWALSDGDAITSWQVEGRSVAAAYYYPAREPTSALGGLFDAVGRLTDAGWIPPVEEPRLKLRIEALESGYARLSGRVPAELRDVIVWVAGIPYPVTVEGGKIELNVARLPNASEAYAQALDPKGRTVAGPVMGVPGSPDLKAKLLAVLVWEGDRTDLDLHAWAGARHTHPQDPDPALSQTAIPGTKLLFDGSGLRRACAFTAESMKNLSLEVTCFSDLGGGADAFLYVVTDPGDPVLRKGWILGPRHLSGKTTQERWPAARWKGE